MGGFYFVSISIVITECLTNVTSSVLIHVDVLTYLTLQINIKVRSYYYAHFTDEEIEEQSD